MGPEEIRAARRQAGSLTDEELALKVYERHNAIGEIERAIGRKQSEIRCLEASVESNQDRVRILLEEVTSRKAKRSL